MLSDVLFERAKSSEDAAFAQIREQVETIMETLQNQKQAFESVCQRKFTYYQEQMRKKDAVIEELSHQLQQARNNSDRSNKETELYKAMIHDLRQEFHRMEIAVAQASLRKEKELKRVKSDYIFRESKQNQQYQASIKESKMVNDNIFSASKTIRKGIVKSRQSKYSQFGQTVNSAQKQTKKHFWPYSNAPKKENHVKIRDFKENQWQQTL